MSNNPRIILVNTTHPGNIGAAARAMKNMGLSQLYLVDPAEFPHCDATARATGADDILNNAVVVEDLNTALKDCTLVFATSARSRHLAWPVCTPRECAKQSVEQDKPVAIVFGRENSGLTNKELALCHYHVNIPTAENFSSLNLAAAVQVVAYELNLAQQSGFSSPVKEGAAKEVDELATADEVMGFYQHLQNTMTRLDFLDPKQPKMLMQRLMRLFNRAHLEKKELNILRGFLTAIDKKVD